MPSGGAGDDRGPDGGELERRDDGATHPPATRSSRAGPTIADAELVAFGVTKEHPVVPVLGECLRLDPRRAQTHEPRRLRLDVDDMDVEVHPVLRLLRFGHALQQELRSRLPARR